MMEQIKNIINRNFLFKKVSPILIGAGLGYAYYYFIGCYGGSCPITSNPYITTLYGGLLGLILAFPGKKENKNGNN